MNGFLVVDKPLGLTSREALDRIRVAFPRGTKVGHAGTLDPLATGVLVLAFGQATRLVEEVQELAKEYVATVTFGADSATDDSEGPITPRSEAVLPGRERLEATLAAFVGVVSQRPPAFSAAHVDGRRAYRLARKGETVKLAPKPVRIDRIELLDYSPPTAKIVVACGKGTYIRSIARDLGESLACGAYLSSLRRTRIGGFREEGAVSIDAPRDELRSKLRPLADAVSHRPSTTFAPETLWKIMSGQTIVVDSTDRETLAVHDEMGRLRAIATIAQNRLRAHKVFPDADVT